MGLVTKLIGFGLRQVIGEETAKSVSETLDRYLGDHSQALPQALAKANERSWQSLGIALAGTSFLEQVRVFFASGEDKGIRDQVSRFLDSNPIPFEGSATDFRKKCLADLKTLKQKKLLAAHHLALRELSQEAAGLQRHRDLQGLIEGAQQTVSRMADDMDTHAPDLARLLRQAPPGGPPLLVAAFSYFFHREIAANRELADLLHFENLKKLAANQALAFAEVSKALGNLGDNFERLFTQLDHIEGKVDTLTDMVARLSQQIADLASRNRVQADARPNPGITIQNDREVTRARALLDDVRKLPPERQKAEDLVLLGDVLRASGLFGESRQSYAVAIERSGDPALQAAAWYKTYLDELEQKRLDAALQALLKACQLDERRFAPFPLKRYKPLRILGAGGFGTVFHCHDTHFRNREVAVKALHADELERNVASVFGEANTLMQLNHPAIVGVLNCDYADYENQARPYVVMAYFPGVSLEAHLREHGPLPEKELLPIALQIARGMKVAHDRQVLHRDLKPDNVLVRKEGGQWQVKIIDFGLALHRQAIEQSQSSRGGTMVSDSVAGTLLYAPPEQLGRLPGVPVSPASDVYAFGKLCCQALFQTTEPKRRHLASVHPCLADTLEKCLEQLPPDRHPDFGPVLEVLEAMELVSIPLDTRPRPAAAGRSGQETGPQQRRPGEVFTNKLGMQFGWIPPGTFLMGGPATEEKRDRDEVQHRVKLTRGFFLGIHPVTQAQWQAVLGSNPSHFKGDNRPVETVAWEQCLDFCQKLSRRDGQAYRLPTEAEWEYACRAGTTTPFHFGGTLSADLANYDATQTYSKGPKGKDRQETTAVGCFPANAWGLFDMHGNVSEWCADWYDNYPAAEVTDPQGPATAATRVLRGGCFNDPPWKCRAAFRFRLDPGYRSFRWGFRVCFFPKDA